MTVKREDLLPTIAQITNLERVAETDKLTELLNSEPPTIWIKKNKYAGNSLYLPIDKIEYLLKTLIKRYKIEILSTSSAFNGVVVCVRIHYVDMITGDWMYHDGIGSEAIQNKSRYISK